MSNLNYNEYDQQDSDKDETVVISKTSKRDKGQAKYGAKSARRAQRQKRVHR